MNETFQTEKLPHIGISPETVTDGFPAHTLECSDKTASASIPEAVSPDACILKQDEVYMKLALAEAEQALEEGEVPVGAVLVWEGRVVASAHNTRERDRNALRHAELTVIDRACSSLHGWRLHKATLYVTLEPCVMCTGALLSARVKRVVYGAPDEKAGGLGSMTDLNCLPLNHHMEVTGGILADMSAELLRIFFENLRINRKKTKKNNKNL